MLNLLYAYSTIHGGTKYPNINGTVTFKKIREGIIVTAKIKNLPHSYKDCSNKIFGFHIHSGSSCTGNSTDEFADALKHYNPNNCKHPEHAGDIPPLFENNGYAYLSFLTNRFTINDIIGKTVIIHSMPDDFTTDPSGNSGEKIACGIITT